MKNIIILLLLTLGIASCKPTGPVPDKQTIYTVNGPCLMAVAEHQSGATDTAYLWNDIDTGGSSILKAIDLRQPLSFVTPSYVCGKVTHTANGQYTVLPGIEVGKLFYYPNGGGGSAVISIHRIGEGQWQIQPDTTSITDDLGRAWCRVKREQ